MRKRQHAILNMLLFDGVDPAVGKQPLKIARTGTVIAKPDRCIDHSVNAVGAHRCVHAKGNIESTTAQPGLQVAICGATFAFVENDKLDARYICHQAGFGLADDPGQVSFRPRILYGADNGQRMTGIADMGKSDDAYTLWRRFFKHFCKPESLTMLTRDARV